MSALQEATVGLQDSKFLVAHVTQVISVKWEQLALFNQGVNLTSIVKLELFLCGLATS
jgi:hypothetical protein